MTTLLRVYVLASGLLIPAFAQGPTRFPPLIRTDLFTDTNGSYEVARLDCDQNGVTDLITANQAGTVTIFRGNADGTFQLNGNLALGASKVYNLAAGDLNGDGKDDLILADGSNFKILVFHGTGNCMFVAQTAITGISPTGMLAMADVNGDGRKDIVFLDGTSRRIGVLIRTASGGYQGAVYSSILGARDGFALGDVDNDGKLDIAVTDTRPASFGIAVARGDGTGSFILPTLVPTGLYPGLATLADLNSDRLKDLVVPVFGGDKVSMLISVAPGPDGVAAFLKRVEVLLPAGSGPGAISAVASPDTQLDLLKGLPPTGKEDTLYVPNLLKNNVTMFRNVSQYLVRANGLAEYVTPESAVYPTGLDPRSALSLGTAGGIVVAPTSQGLTTLASDCTISVSPRGKFEFPPTSSKQIVQVTVPDGCVWTAFAEGPTGQPVEFIRITPPGGVGSKTVVIDAQANPSTLNREAFIDYISGKNREIGSILQYGTNSTCTQPTFNRSGLVLTKDFRLVDVGFPVPFPVRRCETRTATTHPLLSVSPATITDSGPITVTVAPNTADTTTHHVIIGGEVIPITIGSCPITATSPGFVPSSGGLVTVEVTAPQGCAVVPKGAGIVKDITVIPAPSGLQYTLRTTIPTGPGPSMGTITVGNQVLQVLREPAIYDTGFSDTGPSNPFVNHVTMMKTFGLTSGCALDRFCPDSPVTRGQMAVFIARATEGGDFFPYTTTPYFQDVPATHPFFKYVQRIKDKGITAGCSSTNYCPDDAVTRGQMAVFLIRGLLAVVSGVPISYPGAQYFQDVPETNAFYPFIQHMKARSITSGCAATKYCPDDPVTRGQMAVFLIRTFFSPTAE